MSFLTDLDSRAEVKGSRDPLGVQAIWTHFGRHIVGNLTTVSTSVRDFTTVLLGFWAIEKLAEADREQNDLHVFLRWEQLAGYIRATIVGESSFRGTQRVQNKLAESSRVVLSADPAHQILGDQKIYGLWGLYTVPSRNSGLLAGDPLRLTTAARELVEHEYLPILAAAGLKDPSRWLELIGRDSVTVDMNGRQRPMLEALAKLLVPKLTVTERTFFRKHLLLGLPDDRTNGLQSCFAEVLADTLDDNDFAYSMATVTALAKTALKTSAGERLSSRLDRIRACESLLGPSTALYSFVLSRNGASLASIADDVKQEWGPRLRSVRAPEIESIKVELGEASGAEGSDARWTTTAAALNEGDYATAVRTLLDHNRVVMRARFGDGAPWAEEERGVLRVRMQDATAALPAGTALPTLWRHSYFLDSMRRVAHQLN